MQEYLFKKTDILLQAFGSYLNHDHVYYNKYFFYNQLLERSVFIYNSQDSYIKYVQ